MYRDPRPVAPDPDRLRAEARHLRHVAIAAAFRHARRSLAALLRGRRMQPAVPRWAGPRPRPL